MGKLVNVTDTDSALMQLSASIVSIITCSIIVYSIYQDSKTLKKSYHLRLVMRLLLSDIGLSGAIIVYYIMEAILDSTALTSYCNFHISIVVYFFLCSFGWTAMLAFRFRSSHAQTKKLSPPPFDMWVVWCIPVLFAGAVLITAFITNKVSTVEAGTSNTNRSCTFNHDTTTGIIVDIVNYQAPLFFTIVVNCYSYTKGLYYLRNTPQSVLARQMKKAGGYLGVLLVIWVPNFVYNFLTMFDGTDPEYNGFLDLVIFFNTLQGFLNACVYIWCNQKMRNWLWKHLPCVGLCGSGTVSDNKQEFHSGSVQSVGFYNSRNKNNRKNYNMDAEDDSEDEDDEDDSSLASNGHIRDSTDNPISSGSSVGNESSGGSKTKSILIPSKMDGKMIKSHHQQDEAQSYDLDSERYVRFGENQTRMISVASARPSLEIGSPGSDYA